jgi:hypothetical protein
LASPVSVPGFLQGAQWLIAGWSSPVARQAHNLKVTGSNPVPATRQQALENMMFSRAFCCGEIDRQWRSWKYQEERRGGSGGNDLLTLGPYPRPMALSRGFNLLAPTLFPAGEHNI